MYANLRPVPNRPFRHVRHWLIGALAYGALVASAQTNPQATRISLQNLFAATPGLTHIPVQGGGSVSLGQVSGGAVSTRIPLTASTVSTGVPFNGVLRANPGATLGTIEITAGARLPTGPGIPAEVKIPVDKAQLGVALRNFAKRALPVVSTALAIKGLIDDLKLLPPETSDGQWRERVQVDGTSQQETFGWDLPGIGGDQIKHPSPNVACSAAIAFIRSQIDGGAVQVGTGSGCAYTRYGGDPQGVSIYSRGISTIPTSMERIDPVPDSRVDEKVADAPLPKFIPAMEEVIRQGEGIPAKSEPQLSGPSSVLNPTPTTTTTTAPDGTTQTQTQQQRTNVTYNNNNYSTTTTTITNNTNNTTNTTTTTTTENPEPKDPCEGNPNRAGCADLDVPEGEIPREEKNVSFSPVDLGANASGCPAPIAITVPVVGTKYLEFTVFCDTAAKMRPFIVACSALTAMFILSFALRV